MAFETATLVCQVAIPFNALTFTAGWSALGASQLQSTEFTGTASTLDVNAVRSREPSMKR